MTEFTFGNGEIYEGIVYEKDYDPQAVMAEWRSFVAARQAWLREHPLGQEQVNASVIKPTPVRRRNGKR